MTICYTDRLPWKQTDYLATETKATLVNAFHYMSHQFPMSFTQLLNHFQEREQQNMICVDSVESQVFPR